MRKQNQQIMYVHACHLINMLIRLCQGCYILLVFMRFFVVLSDYILDSCD